jgi:2-polyprenyl-6-methoxyphenol hydroxylase-like FAD-dependent oxidoreductase
MARGRFGGHIMSFPAAIRGPAMSRRRCIIVGNGPSGLYLAYDLARLDAGWEIEVIGAESAPGTGIVLDAGFVGQLEQHDPATGIQIRAACQSWDTVRLGLNGVVVASGGHHILGISRGVLVSILRDRAATLGVTFRPEHAVPESLSSRSSQCDFLVGADGARSIVRAQWADEYGTRTEQGRTWYLWMSTDATLDPGFRFVTTEAGVFVAHTYPYDERQSAVVMECRPETVRAAGLADTDKAVVERELTKLFAAYLRGGTLKAATYPWRAFQTISNSCWFSANRVLIGDAAHTTHFSVGSGTQLAIEDSIRLATELAHSRDLSGAFAGYQASRQPEIAAIETDAQSSRLWFEDLDRHAQLHPDQLAFALRTRRQVNTYTWLRRRDPAFTRRVLAVIKTSQRLPNGASMSVTEPRQLPLRLGALTLPNRMVTVGTGDDVDGMAPGLVFDTAEEPVGDLVAHATDHRGQVSRAVLATSFSALQRLLASPHRDSLGALGVLVESMVWKEEQAIRWLRKADFAAVPISANGHRVARTMLAEEFRNGYGMLVLLWTSPLGADEVNTLIAAGRIDGCIVDNGMPGRLRR